MTTKSSIRIWGVLYKSGVYAQKALCLTPGGLPCAPGCRVRRNLDGGESKSTLIAWEKSAEGIVGILQVKLLRHSMSKDGETDMLSRKADTEGPNGSRER